MLSQHTHLVPDTLAFITQLSMLKCEYNDIFVRFEVKDFFMIGDPLAIASKVSSLFGGEEANFFKGVLFFLLTNQFVECRELAGDNSLWKIQRGAGMGLPHSGSTADAMLLACAELHLQATMQTHKVKFFSRFRDDALAICTERSGMHAFCKQYVQAAKPSRVLVEDVSVWCTEWLEVNVAKNLELGKFVTTPRIKPTSLQSFRLESSSNHSIHTHIAWPRAFVAKRIALCSSPLEKIRQHEACMREFTAQQFPEFVLRNIRSYHSLVAQNNRRECEPRVVGSWLTIPLHPCMQGASLAIRRWSKNECVKNLLETIGEDLGTFRIAWCASLPNVNIMVKLQFGGSFGVGRRVKQKKTIVNIVYLFLWALVHNKEQALTFLRSGMGASALTVFSTLWRISSSAGW